MIAKLAYLTTPAPDRYMLNYQAFGSSEVISIEIPPEAMRNILTHGVTLMLRQPIPSPNEEKSHERA